MAMGHELGRLFIRLVGDASGYLATLGMAAGATRSFTRMVSRSFAGLGVGLLGGGLIGGSLALAAQMESMRTTFGTLARDPSMGQALADQLQVLGTTTPLSTAQWARATQTLLQYGVASDQVIGIVKTLGDVVGADSQSLQHMALAIGQVQQFGHLMGQELRQMINAGFNPLTVIAQKTGKTMDELRGLMRGGGIPAQAVINAFRIATQEGGMFFERMKREAATLGGRFHAMVGSIQLALTKFGEDLANAFMLREIMRGITAVVNYTTSLWDQVPAPIRQAVIAVLGFVAAVAGLTLLWAVFGPIVLSVLGAIGAGFSLLLTPLGMISAGAIATFTIFRTSFLAAWNFIQPLVMQIGYMFMAVFQFIGYMIQGFWRVGVAIFTGFFNFVGEVFLGIGRVAGGSWTAMRDNLIKNLIMIEFVARNFFAFMTLAWHIQLLGAVRFGNMLIYFFTEALPAAAVFVANLINNAFMATFDAVKAGVELLIDFIRGRLNRQQLLEGLANIETRQVVPELNVPARVPGAQEQRLQALVNRETEAAGRAYADFERQRMEALFGNGRENRREAEQIGIDLGTALGKGAKKGLEKLEVALWGSAEALARMAHFAEEVGSYDITGRVPTLRAGAMGALVAPAPIGQIGAGPGALIGPGAVPPRPGSGQQTQLTAQQAWSAGAAAATSITPSPNTLPVASLGPMSTGVPTLTSGARVTEVLLDILNELKAIRRAGPGVLQPAAVAAGS